MLLIHVSVVLVAITWINSRHLMALGLQILSTLLAQIFLKFDGVFGIGTEHCIRNITKEWYEADGEIDHDVENHLRSYVVRETTFDLLAGSKDHDCHECINHITNTIKSLDVVLINFRGRKSIIPRNDTNHTRPSKSDSAETKQRHIQSICSTLDLREDFTIVFRESRW